MDSLKRNLREANIWGFPAFSVTTFLAGINVLVFIWGSIVARTIWPTRITQFDIDYGLFGPEVGIRGEQAIVGYAIYTDPATGAEIGRTPILEVIGDQWWRIFTGGFLHSGIAHIAMNMLFLWLLGHRIEREIGPSRFFLLYFGSLVGGSAGALLLTPNAVTVGASGAVFGLMGAAVLGAKFMGNMARESGLLGLLVLNVIISFAVPGISIGGHLGGLLAGALIILAYSGITKFTQDGYYRQQASNDPWVTSDALSGQFAHSRRFKFWRKLEVSLSGLVGIAMGTGFFWLAILAAERATL